jgi:hypothetical protein
MLQRVAADMRLNQNGAEQEEKSRGKKGGDTEEVTDAGMEHADDRLDQGFTLNDVVAEFRALRATVLRRWQHSSVDAATALNESIRFNEAIARCSPNPSVDIRFASVRPETALRASLLTTCVRRWARSPIRANLSCAMKRYQRRA